MISRSIFILFVYFLSSISYALTWDKQCLRDCFCTGHACNYCSYQCQSEDKITALYSQDPYSCPLIEEGNVY